MGKDRIEDFKDFLISQNYPDSLTSIDCARMSQLSQRTPGTTRHAVECLNIVRDWLNDRRNRDSF